MMLMFAIKKYRLQEQACEKSQCKIPGMIKGRNNAEEPRHEWAAGTIS
jgi:hypothetical protein